MSEQMSVLPELRRPGALGIHSLDHFSLAVPDLEQAAEFYTAFGLDVRRDGDSVSLHAFGQPQCWARLTEAPRRKFERLSFGIYEEDVPAFRQRLDRMNVSPATPPSDTESNGIWFHDDEGHLVELAVKAKSSPADKSAFGDVSAPAGMAGAPSRRQAAATRPRRLSHIALYTADVRRKAKFYADVLGLRLSDHVGDFVAFMHGPHGSDHHMLAFVRSAGPGFHHCSWDVGSINEVGIGAEQMWAKGYTTGWGVGRHVLGSNYFYYATDPWGSHAEYSADMDYVPADCDWEAKDHVAEDTYTLWGGEPPPGFMINSELE